MPMALQFFRMPRKPPVEAKASAAALYEQGRVTHRAEFRALEEQMRLMTVAGFQGQGSPDRLDALVWAVTALTFGARPQPRVRML